MKNSIYIKLTINFLSILVLLISCTREQPFKKPPIHLNTNMDIQGKLKTQTSSNFFANGAGMRMPVEHTIARGDLKDDSQLYFGKDKDGNFIDFNPVTSANPSPKDLARGQERFKIYCTPCHGQVGDGDGIVISRGYPIKPPSFYSQKVRAFEDGYIYSVINEGVRNMPPYAPQIPLNDRWKIVAYVRNLQKNRQNLSSNLNDELINQQTTKSY